MLLISQFNEIKVILRDFSDLLKVVSRMKKFLSHSSVGITNFWFRDLGKVFSEVHTPGLYNLHENEK